MKSQMNMHSMVLRIIEHKDVPMNAFDYLDSAQILTRQLREKSLDDVYAVALGGGAISEIAQNIFFERSGVLPIGDLVDQSYAKNLTKTVLQSIMRRDRDLTAISTNQAPGSRSNDQR